MPPRELTPDAASVAGGAVADSTRILRYRQVPMFDIFLLFHMCMYTYGLKKVFRVRLPNPNTHVQHKRTQSFAGFEQARASQSSITRPRNFRGVITKQARLGALHTDKASMTGAATTLDPRADHVPETLWVHTFLATDGLLSV